MKYSHIIRILILILVLPVAVESTTAQDTPAEERSKIDFAHQILPIFRNRCAECHTNGVYQGAFSIETGDAVRSAGAIVPGDADSSELFARITSGEKDYRMPPTGDALSTEQVELVRRWINEGAFWPENISLASNTFSRPLEIPSIPLPTTNEAKTHRVDQLISNYFESKSIQYSGQLSDIEFFRRAKLDLIGLLPTREEISEVSTGTFSRRAAVESLLARDFDYANHWLSFWNDLLRNDYEGTGYIDGGRKQITRWLHRSLMQNKAVDQFARELINPGPDSDGFIKGIKWRGRVNASQIQPLQFSQNVSQVFLGINLKCASCHDSFIDEWKLEDAYGLAAIIADQPLEMHRCDVPTGVTATSKFVFPRLGSIDQEMPREKRLQKLAQLMTDPGNGRFARTFVNRIWHRLMGQGLVEPVDVMSGKAWSEPLLDYLSAEFVASDYDVKKLLRLIVSTRLYRSRCVNQTDGDATFRGVVAKKLSAEQFTDAVWQLSGKRFKKVDARIEPAIGKEQAPQEVYLPISFSRAALLKSNALTRSLGRPNREQVVTTRPQNLSTLQALDLSNGQLFSSWLQRGACRWVEIMRERDWTARQLVEAIYWHAFVTPTLAPGTGIG